MLWSLTQVISSIQELNTANLETPILRKYANIRMLFIFQISKWIPTSAPLNGFSLTNVGNIYWKIFMRAGKFLWFECSSSNLFQWIMNDECLWFSVELTSDLLEAITSYDMLPDKFMIHEVYRLRNIVAIMQMIIIEHCEGRWHHLTVGLISCCCW